MFDIDVTRDEPNVRVYSFGEKNKILLRREDPYGFWKFSLERGFIPQSLDGTYTSVSEAEKILEAHLTQVKKQEVKVLK